MMKIVKDLKTKFSKEIETLKGIQAKSIVLNAYIKKSEKAQINESMV